MYWPSLSLVTLGPLPREDMGAGTGFYNLTRLLGGSFGIALLAVISTNAARCIAATWWST
jgi:DHA2 family multidrug resistance protein